VYDCTKEFRGWELLRNTLQLGGEFIQTLGTFGDHCWIVQDAFQDPCTPKPRHL
jgi:hypothetical protein